MKPTLKPRLRPLDVASLKVRCGLCIVLGGGGVLESLVVCFDDLVICCSVLM